MAFGIHKTQSVSRGADVSHVEESRFRFDSWSCRTIGCSTEAIVRREGPRAVSSRAQDERRPAVYVEAQACTRARAYAEAQADEEGRRRAKTTAVIEGLWPIAVAFACGATVAAFAALVWGMAELVVASAASVFAGCTTLVAGISGYGTDGSERISNRNAGRVL